MSNNLRLDDYAMHLLWRLDDAEDDLAHSKADLDPEWKMGSKMRHYTQISEQFARIVVVQGLWADVFAHIQYMGRIPAAQMRREGAWHLTLSQDTLEDIDLLLFLSRALHARRHGQRSFTDAHMADILSNHYELETRLTRELLRAYRQGSRESVG